MNEETKEVQITITKDKLCIRNFPRCFDPVDDVMFVPLYAPGRSKEESDSMMLEDSDIVSYANYDLTQWSKAETKRFICKQIITQILEDMNLDEEEEKASRGE